jgi:hypothetical protein
MRKLALFILALLALPAMADTVVRGGAKGATAESRITSTASGADHQGLDVVLYDAAGNVLNPAAPVVTGTVAIASTGGNPCVNPGATLVSITGATSTTNATQIIALSGSTKIYVCSMTVIAVSGSATPTFSLVQGTGSNCASNQGTLVQAFSTATAGQVFQFANPVAVSTAGYALCYKGGGTSPVQNYQIVYAQQ